MSKQVTKQVIEQLTTGEWIGDYEMIELLQLDEQQAEAFLIICNDHPDTRERRMAVMQGWLNKHCPQAVVTDCEDVNNDDYLKWKFKEGRPHVSEFTFGSIEIGAENVPCSTMRELLEVLHQRGKLVDSGWHYVVYCPTDYDRALLILTTSSDALTEGSIAHVTLVIPHHYPQAFGMATDGTYEFEFETLDDIRCVRAPSDWKPLTK
jgi:hypothetical protein